MDDHQPGLGRGLDSLIPGLSGDSAGSGVITADVETISPNPLQPRRSWREDELDDLAQSISEHGIIQPIIVSHGDDSTPYRIIVGERRWRAAKRAGLSTIPVIVRDADTVESLEIAIVENVQRSDLNPIEEATAYRHLIDEYGLTQEDIARKVGKSRPAIANSLRLLEASPPVKNAILNNEISAGHARALLALEGSKQHRVLDRVVNERLSVRQTEQLATKLMQPRTSSVRRVERLDPESRAVESELRSALGTKVDLKPRGKGGSIVIHYYSVEELDSIIEKITAAHP